MNAKELIPKLLAHLRERHADESEWASHPELGHLYNGCYKMQADVIDELQAQRDALLAAAKAALSVMEINGSIIVDPTEAIEKVKAAIAKAEETP